MRAIIKNILLLILVDIFALVSGYVITILLTNTFQKFLKKPTIEYGTAIILISPLLCVTVSSLVFLIMKAFRSISFKKMMLVFIFIPLLTSLVLTGWEFLSSKRDELNDKNTNLKIQLEQEILDRPIFPVGSCIEPENKNNLNFKIIKIDEKSYHVKPLNGENTVIFEFKYLNNTYHESPCLE